MEHAAAALRECAALEAALLTPPPPPTPGPGRRRRPRPPVFLSRTSATLVISHAPFTLRGPAPATFAIYGKPFGTGVAIAADRTAAEHPGLGVRVPVGGSVTVSGLKPNETYAFAVAAYTAEGHLIGDVGSLSLHWPAVGIRVTASALARKGDHAFAFAPFTAQGHLDIDVGAICMRPLQHVNLALGS